MSLFDQGPEVWREAALTCNPEDIVDIADQLTVLGEQNQDTAKDIRLILGDVVTSRLHEGTLAPELAHMFFKQTTGYGFGEDRRYSRHLDRELPFAKDFTTISFPETAEEEQERINKWLRDKYGNTNIYDI